MIEAVWSYNTGILAIYHETVVPLTLKAVSWERAMAIVEMEAIFCQEEVRLSATELTSIYPSMTCTPNRMLEEKVMGALNMSLGLVGKGN